MPDHIHCFVRVAGETRLGDWVGGLKRFIAKSAGFPAGYWQRGFFDYVLRSDESYAAKWDYVRVNPLRANLIKEADEWPFAGEIVQIDRV